MVSNNESFPGEIGLPNHEAREAIFHIQLHGRPTTLDEEAYQTLADRTEGLSSADIVGIVDDAAMQAAERDAEANTGAEPIVAVVDTTSHLPRDESDEYRTDIR
ncbi:hypothetical protein [Haloarcula nitratireducens]|uniref:AAA ATPase AAA+ lid domain-containing protein n=1 Tax=Haloarcula nitratireducens TaxID=2487749 RepID=A0AAW4PJ43_9EURY|nr:hypothetical protein [Halomicroarcula nitratireducens]MBX0297237.1 hypothetical protein [Halomicroarcula nitratireducens]